MAQLTDRAVAVTFDVPETLRDAYTFEPGQYLTLRAEIGGADVRRSYSICTSAPEYVASGTVQVASARVPGGVMSNWLSDNARIGQELEVMTPWGDFAASVFSPTGTTLRQHPRQHVAVAAGSGITPIMSLISTALQQEPLSRVTVFFGSRNRDSIMFLQRLNTLEQTYPDRLIVQHVLSGQPSADTRPPSHADLQVRGDLSGRIDRERMTSFLAERVPVADIDQWFVCGPHGMVEGVREVLAGAGADPGTVHQEVFHVENDSR
ncbi:MAG: FAD-binding oxidoreductase [Ornithinimicrobium sp.]